MMRTCVLMTVGVLSAGFLTAAEWNDLAPHDNGQDTAFWNTTGHAVVVNAESSPMIVSGALAGGGSVVESEPLADFDGRPSVEAHSTFVEILRKIGLLLFVR